MNLLQVFFIISWIIILILALDIAKKEKFNALHFFVFISVWIWLLVFTFFPGILNWIGWIFWVQRWADVLVYTSIIFLVYFVLLLLSKIERNKDNITDLIREIAIDNSSKSIIQWKEAFIIPSYNEGSVIINTISNIFSNWYTNILVVNDWSSDNTKKILEEKFWDKIVLLNHYKNRWQWASLETWFEYMRRYGNIDYIITFDADWQHDINDIQIFEKYILENKDVDIFLWSRFLSKKSSQVPFFRKMILKLWIVFTFLLSNINLSDTHNGYRVIKKDILNKIRITIDWMWHASEIIDIISSEKIKHMEVPVNIKYSEYSLKKWQKSWNAIYIALKMIRNKFFK